jgi:hypothetical protein
MGMGHELLEIGAWKVEMTKHERSKQEQILWKNRNDMCLATLSGKKTKI